MLVKKIALFLGLTTVLSAFPSAAYLKLEPSVRFAGMGEIGVALGERAADMWANPASVARIHRFDFSANYMEWITGIQYSVASVAFRPYNKKQEGQEKQTLSTLSYGLSVMTLNAGGMEARNTDGELLGTFSAGAQVVNASFGRILYKGIYGGVSAKWIRDVIDRNIAQGYAFDIGFLYAPDPSYAFGLVIRNLGPGLSYGNQTVYTQTTFALPSDVRVSGSYIYRDPSFGYFAMNADAGWMGLTSTDASDQYAFAGVSAELNILDYLVLRGGYKKPFGMHVQSDNTISAATQTPSVYGFGATVLYGPLEVDYAYYVRNEVMNSHRFGFGVRF